ncbi:hypothetical protein PAPYR_9684 [Paratrimastix pyriformis]|uniref:Uncharacterized protein n=1 Tax=Paratrimastix pyriformis TaxID=342808 RepID=A0ABQ8U7T6_9EUKA|nr:hypothetical protein PAPYR_9684 [Paratrimastix pyriformis]
MEAHVAQYQRTPPFERHEKCPELTRREFRVSELPNVALGFWTRTRRQPSQSRGNAASEEANESSEARSISSAFQVAGSATLMSELLRLLGSHFPVYPYLHDKLLPSSNLAYSLLSPTYFTFREPRFGEVRPDFIALTTYSPAGSPPIPPKEKVDLITFFFLPAEAVPSPPCPCDLHRIPSTGSVIIRERTPAPSLRELGAHDTYVFFFRLSTTKLAQIERDLSVLLARKILAHPKTFRTTPERVIDQEVDELLFSLISFCGILFPESPEEPSEFLDPVCSLKLIFMHSLC